MPQESIAPEKLTRNVPFFKDSFQIVPEVRHVTGRLAEAREIIRKDEPFFRSRGFSEIDQGTKIWKFQQNRIPDDKYDTRPIDRDWIFSYRNNGPIPNFTLSAITAAQDPDTGILSESLPEIRIRYPLSKTEKETNEFVSFGKLAVCIGLRKTDGSIMKDDGGNPKTNTQVLERAGFVVDTFINYINSMLHLKP